jgi:hypothetical protein
VSDLFGGEIFAGADLARLLVRLVIDLAFATVVIRVVYFRVHRQRDYLFTYYLFNLITFSLCMVLRKAPMELGFALGLFAVFGILRYRTEAIRIIDLTYLFIVIGLGILNAAMHTRISLVEILAVNGAIVGMTAVLEAATSRAEKAVPLLYDKLELLRPGREVELIEDLCERTGLRIVRVSVQRIDMLRDAAEITVHHVDAPG